MLLRQLQQAVQRLPLQAHQAAGEAVACVLQATRGTHERHCLREEHPHGVAERNCLLIRRSRRLQLRERCAGQLDRGIQGQRGELLALGLMHGRSLLLRELPQAAQEIVRVAA